jgi:hypothetical protein
MRGAVHFAGPHHLGFPPPLHAQALARGPLAAVRLHRASRTPTPAAIRWRRRVRCPPRRPPALKTSKAQQPPKSVIPTQRRVTEQLTKHWAPFKVLRQRYAGTRFEEQRQLHLPQKHKATVLSLVRDRQSLHYPPLPTRTAL